MTHEPDTIDTIVLGADELARTIFDRIHSEQGMSPDGLCRLIAQDVLDLVASRFNTWQRIEAGATIEEGTKFRFESLLFDGNAIEGTAVNTSRAAKNGRWFIERKPSEQVDPLVEKVAKAIHDADDESDGCSWDDEQHDRTRDVYRRLARAALKAGSPT